MTGAAEDGHEESRRRIVPAGAHVSLKAGGGKPDEGRQWFRNGTPIANGFEEILKIENVTQEDAGLYVYGEGIPRQAGDGIQLYVMPPLPGSPNFSAEVRTLEERETGAPSSFRIQTAKDPSTGYMRGQLVRLLENGKIDPEFKSPLARHADVEAMATLPEGSVVVVGSVGINEERCYAYGARLSPEGKMEIEFDALPEGPAKFDADLPSKATDVLVTEDGDMIIYGQFKTWDGLPRTGVVGLSRGGNIDPEFGLDWGLNGVLEPQMRLLKDGQFQLTDGRAAQWRVYGRTEASRITTWGERAPLSQPMVTVGINHRYRRHEGDHWYIAAEVLGHPRPRIQWYKDGKPLPGETAHMLHRSELETGDTGRYVLKAVNPLGRSISETIQLEVASGTEQPAFYADAKAGWVFSNRYLEDRKGHAWRFDSFCMIAREDGYDDLIVAGHAGPEMGVFRLRNPISADREWELRAVGIDEEKVRYRTAAGDLDNDGHEDLLLFRMPPGVKHGQFLWHKGEAAGRGTGQLRELEVEEWIKEGFVRYMTVDDLDGDGDNDIIVVISEASRKGRVVWLQNEKGVKEWKGQEIGPWKKRFQQDPNIFENTGLEVKDLDGDGDMDINFLDEDGIAHLPEWLENRVSTEEKFIIQDRKRQVVEGDTKGTYVAQGDVNGDGHMDRLYLQPEWDSRDNDDDVDWSRNDGVRRGLRWISGAQ